MTTPIL